MFYCVLLGESCGIVVHQIRLDNQASQATSIASAFSQRHSSPSNTTLLFTYQESILLPGYNSFFRTIEVDEMRAFLNYQAAATRLSKAVVVAGKRSSTKTTNTTTTKNNIFINSSPCYFSTAPDEEKKTFDRQAQKEAIRMHRQYEEHRNLYNKQVSVLRKQYAQEIAQKRAEEERKKKADREEQEARKKERKRLKLLKSIENAKRDVETKKRAAKKFQEHLVKQQVIREAKNERYRKARALLLQELEEESQYWMTTPEEVEQQLGGHETEQLLWSNPHLIGIAPPDALFWKFQSYTQRLEKTFMSPKEYLLERLSEVMVVQASMDSAFWTEERVNKTIERKEKAKLRALVQMYGKEILLKKQNQWLKQKYLEDRAKIEYGESESDRRKLIRPYVKIPPSSLDVLADYKAQEEEGVKLLLKNPSKFFAFENQAQVSHKTSENNEQQQQQQQGEDERLQSEDDDTSTDETHQQEQPLGKPIALIHEFGDDVVEPFEVMLAKDIKRPKYTAKEKQRFFKEDERLAKQKEAQLVESGLDFEHTEFEDVAGEVDHETEDYKEWEDQMMKRFGPSGMTREELRKVSPHERFTDEDMEWIVEKLQDRMKQVTIDMKMENERHGYNKEEKEIMTQIETIIMKLDEEQSNALSSLNLQEQLEGKDEADLDYDALVKNLRETIDGPDAVDYGEDATLTKQEILQLIQIEKKLVDDPELRERLLG